MAVKIEFDPDKVQDVYRNILWKAVLKLHQLAIQKAPVGATSELKQKIDFFPKSKGRDNYKVISMSNHSAAVEFGSRPHHVSPEKLKAWARRKLGDENAAYPIAKKIAKVGTQRHPFMIPALMEVKNVWIPRFAKEESIK